MTAKTRHVKAPAGVTSKTTTGPVSGHDGSWQGAGLLKVRDVSLFVDVIGHGYPVLLMHGGPSLDHWSLMPFRQCAGQFTLIFYDHRCNGRSAGAPVSFMTFENLTADAEALRQELGIERWAVLGHSFGGHVALEYALRYPASLSHLVLLDTGGDAHWARQNAPDVLARRGYSPKKAELVRRWFTGEFTPREYVPNGPADRGRLLPLFQPVADCPRADRGRVAHQVPAAGVHLRRPPPAQGLDGHGPPRPDHRADAGDGGTGRLRVPARVSARADGRHPQARLQIIDRAGHNPHAEQTAEVMAAVRHFLSADTPTA
jgi:proline iminopeptidase